MRRSRSGLIALGLSAMVVVFVPGAAAAAPRASAAICEKVTLVEPDLGQLGGKSDEFDGSEWKAAAKEFKSGAKVVPTKVKTAMNNMATYFQKIGDAGSANKALTKITAGDTTKYAKGVIVWGKYVAKKCP